MNPKSLSVRLLAALLTFSPVLVAQDEPVPAASQAQRAGGINVKFPGGTLMELVELLRLENKQLNIVAPELSAAVPVPPMHLREVSAESALRAASTVIEKQFDLAVQTISSKEGAPVLSLRVQERTRNNGFAGLAPADESRVEVFSLRAITHVQPGEPDGIAIRTASVLTAVDTGLGFVQASKKPSLKFHEDSGLLFVSATIEQLQLVSSVLAQLERSVASARSDAAKRAADTAAAAESAGTQPPKADPRKSPK